jgi:hypothetical protein
MSNQSKRPLFRALAALAAVVALHSVYLLGYRNGSLDALDWDFSAVVAGKVVPIGHGSTLLRSRVDLRPVPNVNIITAPITPPRAQP